jgi:hypothetical protein
MFPGKTAITGKTIKTGKNSARLFGRLPLCLSGSARFWTDYGCVNSKFSRPVN